jgi:uncharacterized surface protein with fasciclin (FAS1) repeats
MKNLFSLGFALLTSALAFAQCDADHTVDVASFSYTPSDLVINQGESVAFVNYGGNHDVNGIASSITGDNFNNPEEFYLPTVMGNADGVCIGTFTFNTPGTYNYDCSVGNHALNGMVATITVNPPVSNTVVDIIVNSDDHTTLETAVVAAGLVETLSGEGPFTVFAPTDAAFAALPAGTLDAVLADIDLLTAILTYHVVGGTALSTDLADGQVVTTLNGADVTVTINAEGVFINDAQVVLADLLADNGVVHVIDAVLLPPVDGIEEAVASWQVVPNPASDVVRLVSVPQNAEVTLRDMSGRVVKTVPQGAQEVHVGELPSGVYFVQWTLGARAATQKLLVQ